MVRSKLGHDASYIDLSSGHVHLRDDAAPLRPRMTLAEFALSPLAKSFPRGFEKRHFAHTGYAVGVHTLYDTDFAVVLGFSSPSSLIPSQDCVLWGVSLHRCLRQGVARRRVRWLAPLYLLADLFRDSRFSEAQWQAQQLETEDHCSQWLKEALNQEDDRQSYPPWGCIELVRAHPRDGCFVQIRYHG